MGGSAPGPHDASPDGAKGVAECIVDLAGRGIPAVAIASRLDAPVDFVRMVIDAAVRSGRLDAFELRRGCAAAGCSPDPASLLCAGCPLRPR